ncbi:MAG TPA: HAD family hydrolase [Thermoanaerobaculia bacterium]
MKNDVLTADRPRYRGVLLDVDGTLVDSNHAHVDAWVQAFSENGYDVPREKVGKLIGMGGDNLLPVALGLDKESAEGKKLSERHTELFKEKLPSLRAFPGVRQLLERIRDDGLDLVVATSANRDELDPLLEIAGVKDLLDEATSADDAESSKPDPDIVHASLDRLGCPPEETVMLGDTPYDVEAAGKAGVRVIAFRCGGLFTDEELKGALAIYDGPADLLARYEESPLAPAAVEHFRT